MVVPFFVIRVFGKAFLNFAKMRGRGNDFIINNLTF
jgi:hypothetical protein